VRDVKLGHRKHQDIGDYSLTTATAASVTITVIKQQRITMIHTLTHTCLCATSGQWYKLSVTKSEMLCTCVFLQFVSWLSTISPDPRRHV